MVSRKKRDKLVLETLTTLASGVAHIMVKLDKLFYDNDSDLDILEAISRLDDDYVSGYNEPDIPVSEEATSWLIAKEQRKKEIVKLEKELKGLKAELKRLAEIRDK